jgi:2-polyprenyl-3-methyl-5-hydroxy-6-metoxy-1,4-benzoquinol methylase
MTENKKTDIELKTQMEHIYTTLPVNDIPWNFETPPAIFEDFVESGKITPCRTIDLGCGTGNYAIYLAEKGFDVTGVDFSSSAIELARNRASQKGLDCTFIVANILSNVEEVSPPFDFVYDWELLHHIYPADRETYLGNVHRLLRPGGSYLSVFFSEENDHFGGSGKYRTTPLGTILYLSSEEEMRMLYRPLFKIEALETIEIKGKFSPHKAIYAFMTK